MIEILRGGDERTDPAGAVRDPLPIRYAAAHQLERAGIAIDDGLHRTPLAVVDHQRRGEGDVFERAGAGRGQGHGDVRGGGRDDAPEDLMLFEECRLGGGEGRFMEQNVLRFDALAEVWMSRR